MGTVTSVVDTSGNDASVRWEETPIGAKINREFESVKSYKKVRLNA